MVMTAFPVAGRSPSEHPTTWKVGAAGAHSQVPWVELTAMMSITGFVEVNTVLNETPSASIPPKGGLSLETVHLRLFGLTWLGSQAIPSVVSWAYAGEAIAPKASKATATVAAIFR